MTFWRSTRVAGSDSIFERLRRFLMIAFAVGGAVSLAVAWLFWNAAANKAYDHLLISAAVQMAETIDVDGSQVVVQPPDAAFKTLALAEEDRIFYAVRDPSRRVLTGDPAFFAGATANRSERPQVGNAYFAGEFLRTAAVGRFVSVPGNEGWCEVVAGQTRGARRALAWSLMAETTVLVVFVTSLGYFASIFAAKRAFQPLAHVEKVLASRQPHDISPLLVESPRETRALVSTINKVMARLAGRMAKLEKFTAVAAHQIRTPLAAVTAQVELLQKDADGRERRARVERIRHRMLELGRLTKQLLGHAMIAHRSDSVPHKPVNLADAAFSALQDGVPMLRRHEIDISFEAPDDPVLVLGDSVVLREALNNLVDNAVTHGAPTTLSVRVGTDGGSGFVSVFDDGPGMQEDQWTTSLIPFAVARGEKAGAALGLSIVSEIVGAHGGAIGCALPEGGGFEVHLTIPLAPADWSPA
jgi:two-component system sensor histidine kinase TctE